MAHQGPTGSSRASGAASRKNAQNAQAIRPASSTPATAQRGLSEEVEEEEGALLEILSLFDDYMKPGKRDEFVAVLLGVLERLDIDPRSQNNTHSDTLSETLREEIQELRGSINELSKALPRALPTTQPGGYKRT